MHSFKSCGLQDRKSAVLPLRELRIKKKHATHQPTGFITQHNISQNQGL